MFDDYILVFHILNYFALIIYLINNCAKKVSTNCPVRQVGDSIRNNIVDVENSTKTAKAQRKNEKSDKSTRTKKAKKVKEKEKTNEEKVPSPGVELTQESGKSSIVQGSTQMSSIKGVRSSQKPSSCIAPNATNGAVLSKSAHPVPLNKAMSTNKAEQTSMFKKKSVKSSESVNTAEKNRSCDK